MSIDLEKDYKYPMLQIDVNKIYENAMNIVNLCNSNNIIVSGVIKGFNGLPRLAEQYLKAGCKHIATSRLEQIVRLKEYGINAPTMLIRAPMASEIKEVVKYFDISFNSEIKTLEQIDQECKLQDRKHKAILMFDLGDLREGIVDEEKFIDLALHVEKNLLNVQLYGIGTNLGCYGSIKPTATNLGRLCCIAEKIENKIGRKLDIISGGSTTSIPLLIDGKMPNKINHLRIGEGISLGKDLDCYWGYKIKNLSQDAFVLKAQVIEVQDKPTFPIGERIVDAFGNIVEYEDRGIRKRALLAIGKQDFSSYDKLTPCDDCVKIIGCSSDHLIVDIEDCEKEIKVGDIMDFYIFYETMLFLCSSEYVSKVYV